MSRAADRRVLLIYGNSLKNVQAERDGKTKDQRL